MIVHRVFKVCIYPNKEQKVQIDKTLGSCRWMYNTMLYECEQYYETYKDDKEKLKEFRFKTEKEYKQENEWLKEADAKALQQARIRLTRSREQAFKSLNSIDKKGFPHFQKKKGTCSYTTTNCNNFTDVRVENNKIKLPKVGFVRFKDGRQCPKGVIKQATIIRTGTGKYYACLDLEREIPDKKKELPKVPKTKGLDMSIPKFYVDENNESPDFIKYFSRYEQHLRKLQQDQAKMKKGSNNWNKQQIKINKVYEKITNCKNYFNHVLSRKLVNENDIIVVESLSLKDMKESELKLGKAISELKYSHFLNCLEYKCEDEGKIFIRADKYFASSKTCSYCGYINKDLKLSDREWICPECGTHHLRDQNAAQNLVNFGLNKIVGWMSPDLQPKPEEMPALKQEIKKNYSNFI